MLVTPGSRFGAGIRTVPGASTRTGFGTVSGIGFSTRLGSLVPARATSRPALRAARGARAGVAARGGARSALFLHALKKADGCPDELELFAQAIFEKPFVTEMQPLGLIGEKNKRGWRRRRLGHVENFNTPAERRSAALQINVCNPTVELPGGYSTTARGSHLIDQRI